MRAIQFVVVCVAVFVAAQAQAVILVDFSPDTTGATEVNDFNQEIPNQYIADQFTWSGGFITGGSIFSDPVFGSVGDSVRFVILPNFAPGAGAGVVPIIDVITTIDTIDSLFTSIDPAMVRKHATIAPTFLAAGNYWFYMAGNGVNIRQSTGIYADNTFDAGFDADPDLEGGTFALGDTFFQLEGNAIPEPTSMALVGIGVAGLGYFHRRKQKKLKLKQAA